jgi:hypothetical protein
MRAKSGPRLPPPHVVDRRRFLKALGLGAVGLGMSSLPERSSAQSNAPVNRILIWLTDHGTVPENWQMNLGFSGTATQIAKLSGAPESMWSPILKPLAPYAAKLNVVEGIGRAPELDYEKRGGSGDRHTFGQTMVLTCVDSVTESDIMGGAASIDQVIGNATTAAGRWAARVYGKNHFKGYSFTAKGRPTPMVGDPKSAFDDIMGLYVPPSGGTPAPTPTMPAAPTREQRIRSARASVLDFAANEFDAIAPRLGRTERLKLEEHRQLIRDLELTFRESGTGTDTKPNAPTAACDPKSYGSDGTTMDQFGRLAALAFSCDMTRVVLMVNSLARGEFSIPSGKDFHQDIAHKADSDAEAKRVMTDFNTAHAKHFAALLGHLDSIADQGGTLLDNTVTTWLTELATGPHELDAVPYVVAGSGAGFLKTDQYVRYGRTHRVSGAWDEYKMGGSSGQFYVTLMKSMGMSDDTFGVSSVQGMEIKGPLKELLA